MFTNISVPVIFLVVSLSASYIFLYYKKTQVIKLLTLVLFSISIFYQISTTNVNNAYSYTPAQIDQQISRMRQYPPSLTRVAYWLEYKKETLMAYKLVENMFNLIDIRLYFPNVFAIVLVPLTLYGIYLFFKQKDRFIITLFSVSLLTLTLIGINGKHGPFIFYPFIVLFLFIALKVELKVRLKK